MSSAFLCPLNGLENGIMEQSKIIALGIIVLLVGVVALQVMKGEEPKTINPAFSEGEKETYKNPNLEAGENITEENPSFQGASSAPGYV